MAGYIGIVDMWDHLFTPAWDEVIQNAPHKIAEFKAADCRGKFGDFTEPPWTAGERLKLTTDLVSIIANAPPTRYVGVGAAVELDLGRVDPDFWTKLKDFAWLWCFRMVVADALDFSRHYLESDKLDLIFDREDDMEHRAYEAYDIMAQAFFPGLRERAHIRGFEDSKEIEPLQAADLLAYETAKEIENRTASPPHTPSIALRRLVGGQRHFARYYDFDTALRVYRGLPCEGVKAGIVYDSRGGGVVRHILPSSGSDEP